MVELLQNYWLEITVGTIGLAIIVGPMALKIPSLFSRKETLAADVKAVVDLAERYPNLKGEISNLATAIVEESLHG